MTKFSVINAETEISVKWFDSEAEAKEYANFLSRKHHEKFIVVTVEA